MPIPRVKFFTGAPSASVLDWNENTLSDTLLPEFKPLTSIRVTSDDKPNSSSNAHANWRSIRNDGKTFQSTATPKDAGYHHGERPGRPLPTLICYEDDFIDHSAAIIEDLDSSQLATHLVDNNDSTLADESTFLSFDTEDATVATIESYSPVILASVQRIPLISSLVTTLRNIPNAVSLLRLRPQTMTVDLIVGVIAISEPRTVHVRKGNYDMTITTLTVGDETRAGFAISVWQCSVQSPGKPTSRANSCRHVKSKTLQHEFKPRAAMCSLRTVIASLRRGDVVHVSRLALTAWEGQVYGQTLNRRASGVLTSVIKLGSAADGVADSLTSQRKDIIDKIVRVGDWVENFVGVDLARDRKRRRLSSTSNDVTMRHAGQRRSGRLRYKLDESLLPPDTP